MPAAEEQPRRHPWIQPVWGHRRARRRHRARVLWPEPWTGRLDAGPAWAGRGGRAGGDLHSSAAPARRHQPAALCHGHHAGAGEMALHVSVGTMPCMGCAFAGCRDIVAGRGWLAGWLASDTEPPPPHPIPSPRNPGGHIGDVHAAWQHRCASDAGPVRRRGARHGLVPAFQRFFRRHGRRGHRQAVLVGKRDAPAPCRVPGGTRLPAGGRGAAVLALPNGAATRSGEGKGGGRKDGGGAPGGKGGP